MDVILLTVFIGFVLVFLFLTLFYQHFSKSGSFSPDRESLLPLEADAGFQEDRGGYRAVLSGNRAQIEKGSCFNRSNQKSGRGK